jgi:8-oxo-dGTP pyrophosphatase MutT (NUDIX family)
VIYQGDPVKAVEASTVILVRHGIRSGSPWQCYMVRRHIRSEFASDVYVFPGGKVDAADADPLLTPYVASHPRPLGGPTISDDFWKAIQLAAIRELFEEAGVLLARQQDGALLHIDEHSAGRYESYREALHRGELSLLELAQRERISFAADALHPLSRWITPESFPRRFDTHFFVALMPPHQTPLHDQRETTAGEWIAPGEALARYRSGNFPLVFATEKHLERLERFRSIEEMMAETALADLHPVMPRMVERDGEQIFLVPGDEGY